MKKLTKKYLILLLKKKTAGIKKNVMNKRFKEKSPIVDNICKLSIDHEKLYAQRFQGNPVRIVLLKKSATEKIPLIKKIEDIFLSEKFPINNIGSEKNKDRNKGINSNPNGIKNLNETSKVSE